MGKYIRSRRFKKAERVVKARPRNIWYRWLERAFRRKRNHSTPENVSSFHALNSINLCVKVSNNKLTVNAMGGLLDHFGENTAGINKIVYKANNFYSKINKKTNMLKPSQ